MLFNSIEFAIFLPIVFLLYWTIFKKNLCLQNLFVITVSYVFYGWWNWKFLILIAFTSLCSFLSGILIDKYRNRKQISVTINTINIVINVLILCLFKYYNFFVQSFADLFLGGKSDFPLLKIVLPVGVSFYTFQALSYSIDVYRKKISPTKDIFAFFAFISFFPQLVAGPIERATNLLPQFHKERVFDYNKAIDGSFQIIWGLFKKIVIADNCAVYVNYVFDNSNSLNASTLLCGMIFFSIQIYCDFSGYSDIAIGTAKLFGIELMRNFNVPYLSRDIAEFWRRWHISLTTWFRDYIYIPLGGSRCSEIKIIRNTIIIFLVSGLWHGANWTFVIWGLYHAILFLPLILLKINRSHTDTVASNQSIPSIKEFIQMLCTFILVAFGWIIFRSESLVDACHYVIRIFNNSWFSLPDISKLNNSIILIISLLILILVEWNGRKRTYPLEKLSKKLLIPLSYTLIVFIFFSTGNESNFIYFQF